MARFTRIEQPGPLAIDDSKEAMYEYEDALVASAQFWMGLVLVTRDAPDTTASVLANTMCAGMSEAVKALRSDTPSLPGTDENYRQRLLNGLAMTKLQRRIVVASRLSFRGLMVQKRPDMVHDIEIDDMPATPQKYRLHVAQRRVAACFGEVATGETVWYEGGGLYVESREPAELSNNAQAAILSRDISVAPDLVTLTPYLPAQKV